MIRTIRKLLAFSALALASPALAQTLVDANRDGLAALLPEPPADDTLVGRADLEAVLLIQSMRRPDDEREAAEDADLSPVEWARRRLGPGYAPDRCPEAFALFDAVRADMTKVVDEVKARGHQRPRPHRRDVRVRPSLSIEGHGSNSWPSGRAAATRVWAGVLSELFPARAEALAAAARRSGELRIIGGVHYPTDVAAGHTLADAFLARLRAHSEYRRRLSQVRTSARLANCRRASAVAAIPQPPEHPRLP